MLTLREILQIIPGSAWVRVYRNKIMILSGYVRYFDLDSDCSTLSRVVTHIEMGENEKILIILK